MLSRLFLQLPKCSQKAAKISLGIVSDVARSLFILIFCATVAVLLGRGYYVAYRSGVLTTIKGYRARRDQERVPYWFGMVAGVFAFLLMASGAALMAFLVLMDLHAL